MYTAQASFPTLVKNKKQPLVTQALTKKTPSTWNAIPNWRAVSTREQVRHALTILVPDQLRLQWIRDGCCGNVAYSSDLMSFLPNIVDEKLYILISTFQFKKNLHPGSSLTKALFFHDLKLSLGVDERTRPQLMHRETESNHMKHIAKTLLYEMEILIKYQPVLKKCLFSLKSSLVLNIFLLPQWPEGEIQKDVEKVRYRKLGRKVTRDQQVRDGVWRVLEKKVECETWRRCEGKNGKSVRRKVASKEKG